MLQSERFLPMVEMTMLSEISYFRFPQQELIMNENIILKPRFPGGELHLFVILVIRICNLGFGNWILCDIVLISL